MKKKASHAIQFTVAPPGGRLDRVVASRLSEYSRSRIQALIRGGHLAVDGEVITRGAHQVGGGESISLQVPAVKPASLEPEPIALEVVFENRDVLAVNKPPGMVVHPSSGHASGTLVHAALAHAPDIRGIGGEQRPGVVHRLDKDTSGLILLAKHDRAMAELQRQFKARKVEKTYLALVDGRPRTSRGRIDAAIGRHPRHRKRMAVVPSNRGRAAETIFSTRETFAAHTLLEVHPVTGRTHQVRVHLAFIDCPVTGDRVYGPRKPSLPVDRHCLHAWRLTLRLPGQGESRTLTAPLAEDMAHLLESLRREGDS